MAINRNTSKQSGGSDSWSTGGSESYGGSSSDTTSYTNSHTEGGSESSTYGGSSSHSESSSVGGSKSQTSGSSIGGSSSQTSGSSQGGNTSISTGKSWASGEVSDTTQQNFDKYNNGYQQSENVTNAYNALQEAITGKPTFQSTYEDKLNSLYDQIMNRDKFSYNFNEDQMYQQYKDQYTTQGKQAMQDTMGQAAALTGGYGSSYSQTAAQQTYQNYLNQLNDIIPTLRNQAYSEYQDEGENLLNQYNLTNSAYNNEYSQYRDDVSDWQTDRSFAQSNYQDERNFDYSNYSADRSYWQNQYWNERNAEQSNSNASLGTNWSDSLSNTNSANWSQSNSQTNSTNWSNSSTDTDSTNWSNTSTRSWSDTDSTTNSHTDSTNWSNSNNWSNSGSTNWSNSDTNSWSNDTGSNASASSNYVQYSNPNSFSSLTSSQRADKIDQISDWALDGTESSLRSNLLKVYKNGYDENGQNIQVSVEDITNMYNRAISQSVEANGKAQEKGMTKMTTSDMAKFLGISL